MLSLISVFLDVACVGACMRWCVYFLKHLLISVLCYIVCGLYAVRACMLDISLILSKTRSKIYAVWYLLTDDILCGVALGSYG